MTNEVRLIDANALKFRMGAEVNGILTGIVTAEDIRNAPTIIADNYAMGYQDGVRKVLSELAEQGHEFGNIFGDCKPTFEAIVKEEQENDNQVL